MNKGTFGLFFLFAALLSGALYYGKFIQSPFLFVTNNIKSGYHTAVESVVNTFHEHFNQQERIKRLRAELTKYEKNHLVMHQFATELNDLFQENNSSFKLSPNVTLVRALSYAKFGDTNKLWLQMHDFNRSKVYGLVYKERAAGIVVNKDDKPLALLNDDYKCTYAVYVGKEMAPGIVHGQNEKQLIVNFIPTWIPISVGDEVVTSGMDNLFFKGLKVGKVLSVHTSQGYQSAIIEPYYQSNEPSYFHVITKVR